MPVTNYYTVDSEIIAEKTTGGSRTDYLTDALGSVTATMDQNAQVVNTYRYKPYGAQLAKAGAGMDPAFQWVGSHGYRQTAKKHSDVYVRARHYGSPEGVWTTRDPLFILAMEINTYNYSWSRPTLVTDPTGWYPTATCADGCMGTDEATACADFRDRIGGWGILRPPPGVTGTILGVVYCCNGIPYACTNPVLDTNLDTNPYRPLIKACVKYHERQHIRQGCVCKPHTAQGQTYDFQTCQSPPNLYDQRECEAYNKQIECLRSAGFACQFYPDPNACLKRLREVMQDICDTAVSFWCQDAKDRTSLCGTINQLR